MKRRLWVTNRFSCDEKLGLSVYVSELSDAKDAVQYEISFAAFACLEVLPEQISWPSYETKVELEIIPNLLYKLRPGSYESEETEIFDQQAGWVKASNVPCYVIHTDSYDFYVASLNAPVTALLSDG